jgi:hypothetical protein
MKTLKTKLFASLYVALFILIIISGTKKVSATENVPVVTELNDKAIISKIYVKGNVEVFITQGDEQSIKVYDNYYGKNALTQIENDGTLRISSHSDKKLSIWVTVENLKIIEAHDQAVIYSINNFKALDLQVTLSNNAMAHLDIDTYELNTTISDSFKLVLLGRAEVQNVYASNYSNIDVSQFEAVSENLTIKDQSSITLGNQQNFKPAMVKCENQKCASKLGLLTL